MAMEWYEPEVRYLESLSRTTDFPEHPVVFYGSSSIRLWNTLSKDLDSDEIVNRGFGGSTLEACAYYFDRLVSPLRPRSLLLYAGDNDLGDGRSPEEVLGYFRELVRKFEAKCHGIPFAFLSIKPSPARFGIVDRIAKTNEYIRHEIEARPGFYYVDAFPAMVTSDGQNHIQPRHELYLEDGLHMSSAGYEVWTEKLKPYCKRLLIEQSYVRHILRLASSKGESGLSQMVQPTAEP
jgi:lysophospholipase L1-like esterase